MPYQFADQRQDYSDYSSGKVFYNLPGHPAFPIRLASEIFQRCLEIRSQSGLKGTVRVYDPLCGGAYHLATLAYLHWDSIRAILASDIDPDAVAVADRNLSLLTLEGMDRRIHALTEFHLRYGKASHAEALSSAATLKRRLEENLSRHSIPTRTFQADGLDPEAVAAGLEGTPADLVITDIPYGQQSSWQAPALLEDGQTPLSRMLTVLAGHLADGAVVAVASPKTVKIAHPAYDPRGKLQIGLRRIAFLQKRAERF